MKKAILELETVEEKPTVSIDGKPYSLNIPPSPLDQQRALALKRRYEALSEKDELTPEEEKKLEDAYFGMFAIIIDAPREVVAKLSSGSQSKLMQAFLMTDGGAQAE